VLRGEGALVEQARGPLAGRGGQPLAPCSLTLYLSVVLSAANGSSRTSFARDDVLVSDPDGRRFSVPRCVGCLRSRHRRALSIALRRRAADAVCGRHRQTRLRTRSDVLSARFSSIAQYVRRVRVRSASSRISASATPSDPDAHPQASSA
jgi:hypothetical protein